MAKKVKVLCFSFLSLDNVDKNPCDLIGWCLSIFTAMSGYRHLLYSQIPVDLESPEPFWLGSQAPDDSPSEISPECPSQIPPECPSQVPGQSRRQFFEVTGVVTGGFRVLRAFWHVAPAHKS
ncbi:hypothetical protein HID58_007440, partial [Brassica napus]